MKADPERRAASFLALEPDLAAVRLDDLSRQDEAEPGAGDAALSPHIAAEELGEEPVFVLLGDAETVIAHPDGDLVPNPPGSYLHLASLRGVLDPVRE